VELVGKSVILRYAEIGDAEFIYSLRISPERNAHVSAVSGGVEAQRRWLDAYKSRELAGLEYYFIIELNGDPVGTVRIYDIQGESFCWGSWMMKPGVPASCAMESAVLIYEFAFYRLGFQRSHFDVRKGNSRVVAFHQRFGANIVRESDIDYFFDYPKSAYESVRSKYKKFLTINEGDNEQ
jgi:RimJ/RimL family protein N-acetyltransferase